MTSEETIVLTRKEYNALLERNNELEDRLAALDADDGVRVPHEVALGHHGRQGANPRLSEPPEASHSKSLSERTDLAVSYLSEIERGIKPGSASALARIAGALDTTIDVLVSE